MQLGKLQKFWVSQLEKHTDRQMDDYLGQGTPRKYKACCLGELRLCEFRLKKEKLPFSGRNIIDSEKDEDGFLYTDEGTLPYSWRKYGLRDDSGKFRNEVSARYLVRIGVLSKDRVKTNLELMYIDGDEDKIFFQPENKFSSLASMNDSGFTWQEIAKYIKHSTGNVIKKSV